MWKDSVRQYGRLVEVQMMLNASFFCRAIYIDKLKSLLDFTKQCQCIFRVSHYLM